MKINICYLILNLLALIVAKIYLKDKKLSFKQSLLLLGTYLIFTFLTCSWINGMINKIFNLTFLDVKSYLILLIITNTIILYTMNHSIKKGYKIINYILFILIIKIFGATLSVVLGNKFNQFYIMDIANAVNFMNLSFVIFIIYLITISIIYIGYNLFKQEPLTEKEFILSKINIKDIKIPKLTLPIKKKKTNTQVKLLTKEELLNYNKEKGFYINGEECSIIFEDSNKDNIIKNYYTLNEDIHAKLTNGYTLEENKLVKSICMKFKVGNLNNIDLNNTNILNKISIDEYNFLKKYLF